MKPTPPSLRSAPLEKGGQPGSRRLGAARRLLARLWASLPFRALRTPRFASTLALIGALTAGLAACGSTTPIRYHTLLAPATIGAPATGAPFLIEVLPVGIPAQLDQPQLVVRNGDSGLFLPETERWAAPLADEFRDALSAELTRRLGTQDVAGLARPGGRPLLKIKVQVRRLDAWLGQRIQLEADWSIAASGTTAASSPSLLSSPSGTADTTRPGYQGRFDLPAPGGFPELVQAGQRAIAVLAERITIDAQDRLTPVNETRIRLDPSQHRPAP